MTDLSHLKLYERLELAKDQLEPVQSDYRVVFEADLDNPASVLVPDPNWMACALHGGILPSVEVYHQLETDENERITNGYLLHETTPVGPMTEEEAIEYLVQKDMPVHVWQQGSANAKRMVICRKKQLPASREWRDAWKINQDIQFKEIA